MQDLLPITKQKPGTVSIENFDGIKKALEEKLELYKNIVYDENAVKDAKKDKAELTKLQKELNERCREMKRLYMQPYTEAETKIKELTAMLDEPIALIKAFIDEADEKEKSLRRQAISDYYEKISAPLGNLAETIFKNANFYSSKWENKSARLAAVHSEMDKKVADVCRDISAIQASGGVNTPALMNHYLETLSTEGLADYNASLIKLNNAESVDSSDVPSDDRTVGYKILKISATADKMLQIMEQLELMGVDVEEIEDGMPHDMEELTVPDFDSFVAFDLEHSGSFGAERGDGPSEITEIGAVKVVSGKITDKFSQLVNPGRAITPHVAKLTGITDGMVADCPKIGTVIKDFKDFVGDSILVGHNIKNCDLPYIIRAAKKSGIAFENSFFDTYRFASRMKAEKGWDNVKLEYLSKFFGIEQADAHRAWCDAEANAGVYLKLKELYK